LDDPGHRKVRVLLRPAVLKGEGRLHLGKPPVTQLFGEAHDRVGNGVEGFGHRLDRDVSDSIPVFPNVIDDLVIGVIQLVLIQLHSFLKPHEKNPRIPLGRPRPAWSIRGFVVSCVYCN
jgi:hypothetical protein